MLFHVVPFDALTMAMGYGVYTENVDDDYGCCAFTEFNDNAKVTVLLIVKNIKSESDCNMSDKCVIVRC